MPQRTELTPLILRSLSKSADLSTIRHLDASKKKLDRIGSHLQKLCPHLRSLDLSHNRLKRADEIPFETFNLNLSHNKIECIPSPDLFPKVMGTLDLSHNKLTSILPLIQNKFVVNLVVEGNPLDADYRSQIIRSAPHIWCIDNAFITEKERLSVGSDSSSVKAPTTVAVVFG